MEMGFLLALAALLSCPASLVLSASNKTNCDQPMSNNDTCSQVACSPSVGRQRHMMNANSTVQEAVATRCPALRPS